MAKLRVLFSIITFIFSAHVFASSGQIAQANGIEIWYETFGEKKDPALLMVMGGCCQGIMWPVELCEQFADQGFYVIRYDHRDMGLSTCIDFEENPYDLLDMANDAMGLLDFLKIQKAHVFGMSMGGPITELMAVYFPERIQTITLMATSPDFRPMNLAFADLPAELDSLSGPSEEYLRLANEILKFPPNTNEEKLEQRVTIWHFLNGSVFPLEERGLREIHQQFLSRLRYSEGFKNHILATKDSEELVRTVPYLVKVPTLIFHGSEDPIFLPDHGEKLANIISHSKYIYLEGMGHVPNPYFFDLFVKEIREHALDRFSKMD